jgi:hypothetical protein
VSPGAIFTVLSTAVTIRAISESEVWQVFFCPIAGEEFPQKTHTHAKTRIQSLFIHSPRYSLAKLET